jgi:hypothetical protein
LTSQPASVRPLRIVLLTMKPCAWSSAGTQRFAAGHHVWWSPTIRAALVAGMPFADVFCPGCRTSRSIDLRTIDRHPLASVGSLVLGLRCSWCRGNAPMPKIAGLYAVAPAAQTKRTKSTI